MKLEISDMRQEFGSVRKEISEVRLYRDLLDGASWCGSHTF